MEKTDLEYCYADNPTAMRVEGIEEWIKTLLPMGEFEEDYSVFLRVIDPKTKAVFLIKGVL